MEAFCAKLADILEVDEVRPEDRLQDFDTWDSLSALSIIAVLGSDYGIQMSAMELRNIRTVAELTAAVPREKVES
jgi:acyl carrier protein